MANRSLNKATLIGNLTRDPELRYTPNGTAVCSFGLATNRSWTTDTGEKREETEFHRIVSWNKLAELCSQLLTKGRKVYLEGRLSTRSWSGQDGNQRTVTEIVIEDMILLDAKRTGTEEPSAESQGHVAQKSEDIGLDDTTGKGEKTKTGKKATEEGADTEQVASEDLNPDDIPF